MKGMGLSRSSFRRGLAAHFESKVASIMPRAFPTVTYSQWRDDDKRANTPLAGSLAFKR
jgi:hypothetical protein